ncbi:DUF6084 family protein [Nocardiopsis rhodophaea]|uniref:DUF6084 family protein n=1 Tax=Nocardiopsis rhodophaea TaxID=280238 RepID=UPI0031E44EC5
MSELDFACVDAVVDRYAAAPTLTLRLNVTDTGGQPVHGLMLRCHLRIQPRRRSYSEGEAARLRDVFGGPGEWGRGLRPLSLAQVSLTVPPFHGTTELDLPVPFTYDFEVAATKYLHGVRDGDIPLELLFSGTIFRRGDQGFTVDQVPWDREATYQLPVRVWREMMDHYFPDAGWVRLRSATIDALHAFRSRSALPTWDDAVLHLLGQAAEVGDDV